MVAQVRFKSVQWMLAAVIAVAPTAVLAQQPNATQSQIEQNQAQPAATQAKPEEAQRQTEGTPAKSEKDEKVISGMSILGNQDAPKSLVIVPWKSSEIGDSVGISTMLDDSRLPIDKEVFMRMLNYYEIRSEMARPSGASTEKKAAQPVTAAQRRKS